MANFNKNMNELKKYLDNNEIILSAIFGVYDTKIVRNETIRSGIMVATNNRIVFFAKKIFGYDMESIQYKNISSLEIKKSLMGSKILFYTSNNKIELKWIKNGDIHAFSNEVKSKINTIDNQKSTIGFIENDIYQQIEKLTNLKEKCIITEKEYEEKKNILLSRI